VERPGETVKERRGERTTTGRSGGGGRERGRADQVREGAGDESKGVEANNQSSEDGEKRERKRRRMMMVRKGQSGDN
jgi:hypothetical protein